MCGAIRGAICGADMRGAYIRGADICGAAMRGAGAKCGAAGRAACCRGSSATAMRRLLGTCCRRNTGDKHRCQQQRAFLSCHFVILHQLQDAKFGPLTD